MKLLDKEFDSKSPQEKQEEYEQLTDKANFTIEKIGLLMMEYNKKIGVIKSLN